MNPTVVGDKSCSCTRQVLIAADLVGCKVDVQEKADAPTTVITPEGTIIDNVASALRYFARMRPGVALYGRTEDEAAQVDSWLSFAELSILIPAMAWMSWHKQGGSEEQIKKDIVKNLSCKVESHLLLHTFLAGERMSIADLHLASAILSIESMCKDILNEMPNTQRWFNTITGHGVVKKYLTATKDAAKKDPKKEVKKEVKKEIKKEKKEAPKTEAKGGNQSTAAEIEAQIEAEEKAAKKKINPLDTLPPTPFVLDAWKREYSNTKDLLGVAMPWFWKNVDTEGWSFWYMKYDKCEGENTVGFTTGNMLGGFLQRLDGNFRKYSFGVINVVGETGNFDIQGVWLLRGQEIPFELKDHPSFEYHTFRKLDGQADKQLIEDYWCNDSSVEGRPIDSCKVWK